MECMKKKELVSVFSLCPNQLRRENYVSLLILPMCAWWTRSYFSSGFAKGQFRNPYQIGREAHVMEAEYACAKEGPGSFRSWQTSRDPMPHHASSEAHNINCMSSLEEWQTHPFRCAYKILSLHFTNTVIISHSLPSLIMLVEEYAQNSKSTNFLPMGHISEWKWLCHLQLRFR